ncbi:MAG: cupin-like domain-containing protein [Cyanobacteriota bacterium]|nr:cupin-like domain-containing protein [Cyanobacteriota bacterium]
MTEQISTIALSTQHDIENQSSEELEAFLTDERLPLQERAKVASHILGLDRDRQNATANIQPELSEEWKKWIVENKCLNVPDRDLISAMVDNGIDPKIATEAINRVTSEPSFQAESHAVQRLKKLESILEINRKLADLAPNSGTIERKSHLSRSEFLEKYYATNTPVILTDMMQDLPAMSLWCPEYLKTKYGDSLVEVQTNRNSNPNYEIDTQKHKQIVKLSEYADRVVSGGETNDYYMVANNGNLEREDLKPLLDDIQMFSEFLDSSKTKERVFFWFGPAGTITPLHHDPMNLMMAHVYGRKRWRLISPDATPLLYNNVGVFSEVDLENLDDEKYPLFRDVRVIETVLEPGEVIFIPVGWWHQVKSLDISIALSFTNFIFPNEYNYQNPNITTTKSENSQRQGQGQDAILPKNEVQQKDARRYADSTPIAHIPSQVLTNEIVATSDAGYLIDAIYRDEPLVISFGFVSWDTPASFDFYGRTKKLEKLAQQPLNRILVRDISNSWYHRGIPGLGTNVDEVAESLKQLIKQISPSKVIAIGQSMGAYAAIMFGQLIGANQIIAFGTLSFLDSKKAKNINDIRWLSVMSLLEQNLPDVCYFDLLELCQNSSHSPDIQLFYGRKPDTETEGEINLDDFHATRLNELPNCTIHPYEESGHAIVKYLIDNKLIDRILLNTLFGIKIDTPVQKRVESLPEGWDTWIIENLTRGVPPEQLAEVLQKQGFANSDIKAAMDCDRIQHLLARTNQLSAMSS